MTGLNNAHSPTICRILGRNKPAMFDQAFHQTGSGSTGRHSPPKLSFLYSEAISSSRWISCRRNGGGRSGLDCFQGNGPLVLVLQLHEAAIRSARTTARRGPSMPRAGKPQENGNRRPSIYYRVAAQGSETKSISTDRSMASKRSRIWPKEPDWAWACTIRWQKRDQ